MDESLETILCGNNETGITQNTDGSMLTLYCKGSKIMSVADHLMIIYSRISRAKGTTAVSASTLTLAVDGTLFPISGTTTINHLTTLGWSEGSAVVLLFTEPLTVTHNAAAPPANSAPIKLSGSTDFTPTADSTLSLVYDGSFWFETGRKV